MTSHQGREHGLQTLHIPREFPSLGYALPRALNVHLNTERIAMYRHWRSAQTIGWIHACDMHGLWSLCLSSSPCKYACVRNHLSQIVFSRRGHSAGLDRGPIRTNQPPSAHSLHHRPYSQFRRQSFNLLTSILRFSPGEMCDQG